VSKQSNACFTPLNTDISSQRTLAEKSREQVTTEWH